MGGFGQKMPSLAGSAPGTPPERQGDLFKPPVPDDRVAEFYKAMREARERTGGDPPEWLVNNLVTRYFGESLEQAWKGGQETFGSGRTLDQRLGGIADMAMGGGKFAAPFALPYAVAAEGLLPVLAGMGVGTGVGMGSEELAKSAGAGEGTQKFIGALTGGVAGGAFGTEEGLMARGRDFDWLASKLPGAGDERGSWSWKPGTKLAQIPEDVEIPRAGKRLTIHDLGAYFNERMARSLGQVPQDAPPSRKLNRILKVAIPEFEDQLSQPDPKLDFYTIDTPQADRDVKQAFPELNTDKTRFVLQKALSANFSPGSEPIDEAYNGVLAYDLYKRTGKVPLKRTPDVGWQGYNAAATMERLQRYIDYFGGGPKGEAALIKFLTSKHTIADLQKVNSNVYGTKAMQNDIVRGSLIFGPKVGEYFDDIMGIKRKSSTIDQWEVRANQRRLGDTLRNGKLIDTPLSNSDRDVFQELHAILADRYKLTRNQAQSGTWHYEKGLYTKLGVPSPPTGRSDGTLRALGEMGKSRPPSPQAKPTQVNLRQLQVKPYR